ncbi:pentatricopeptide repeat-containing protein At4g02750-like [Selaginella moellendorffii]|uniref:pentatricopeptide repeat-containing protein At4g02750-like n=1 Tax=Selaginella moellendorffii TaxID=88036 RepID=UPI000D1C99F3|nr:pentatricopeptide repeat-containing protein At4g02750-like [Selaginella moellendorffii]|eukprot:XP_024515860.1 pentatricopeptide repeat-containing protein At4g02750-like [Selaginella moellendorffii]
MDTKDSDSFVVHPLIARDPCSNPQETHEFDIRGEFLRISKSPRSIGTTRKEPNLVVVRLCESWGSHPGKKEWNLVAWSSLLAAYAQNGDLRKAKNVFDFMQSRNIVCYSTLLTMYTRFCSLDHAKLFFDQMPEWNLVSWNVLLSAYAKSGDLESVQEVFLIMEAWNLVSGATMITGYTKCGHIGKAQAIFKSLPLWNAVACTAMLTGYAQTGHVLLAKQVFDTMPVRGIVTWNAMLACYARNGYTEDAKAIFHGMKEHDIVSLTTMLSCSPCLADAESLFNRFPERNLCSENVMLDAYVSGGKIEQAKRFFDGMKYHDFQSLVVMVLGFSHAGRLEEAKYVFEEAREFNPVLWTCMGSAYAQSGHFEEARQIFGNASDVVFLDDNANEKIAWHLHDHNDLVFCNAHLSVCLQDGDFVEGVQKFHRMKQRDQVTWNSVVSAYIRRGQVITAARLFDRLPVRDVTSWNLVLAGLCWKIDSEVRNEVFHKMILMEMPDEVTLLCKLNLCSHEGNLANFSRWFASLRSDFGLEPTKQHYSTAIDILSRAGDLREAWDLLNTMPFYPDTMEWTKITKHKH